MWRERLSNVKVGVMFLVVVWFVVDFLVGTGIVVYFEAVC
jgi:hypothetical protein